MNICSEIIAVDTKSEFDVVDITDRAERILASTRFSTGTLTLFAIGATVGLTTVEYEPGLVADMEAFFERIAPKGVDYKHNERWQDGNGHSHLRASLVGPSLTVTFLGGNLTLGQWQHIVLLDFDVGARHREIICHVAGESLE